MSSQQRPERTELSKALSHFDWNSDDQSIKKHEHLMCYCIFLVYFPISSHIFSDALCGNVSLSQLCSREQETVVPGLGQVLKGGAAPPRGQQDGVHRGNAELGTGVLLPSVGTDWAPDAVQAAGGNAGSEEDKEDHAMQDLGLWDTDKLVCSLFVQSLCRVRLCNPVNHSPPGSSVHGDPPGKNTGVDCHVLLQGSFPTQGSN